MSKVMDERVCCCGDAFVDHDPGQCTGQGCTCRGFHEPGSPVLCRALHYAVSRG